MRNFSTHPATLLVLALAMVGAGVPINCFLGSLGLTTNQQQVVSGVIFTMVGLVLFRGGPQLQVERPQTCLLLAVYIETVLALTMCCLGLTSLLATFSGHALIEVPIRYQWIGVKPHVPIAELGRMDDHSIPLYLTRALVTAPLWEELLRGCLQGVAAWLGANRFLAIFVIALYFAWFHQGYVLATLPVFLFLGWLVDQGVGWLERALIHSLCNLIVTLNMVTANIGGSDLNSPRSQALSLGVQAALLLLIVIRTTPAIEGLIRRRRESRTI